MSGSCIENYYKISYTEVVLETVDYNHNCIFIDIDDDKIDGRLLWTITQHQCVIVIWSHKMPAIIGVQPDSDFWRICHILDCSLFYKSEIQNSGIILKI